MRERSEFDEKARREVDDDEGNDDDENMRDAKIDRGGDSVNNLSEVDRCDFLRMNDLIDESHLLNC
jgi:hypothetical protein